MIYSTQTRAAVGVAVAWLAMSCIAVSTPALAGQPDGSAKAACTADLATLCSGIEAGDGKKLHCLMESQAKLSPACAASLDARAARRGEMHVAQAPTSPPASGTAPPTAAPPQATPPPPQAQPIRPNLRACRTDMATFCANVQQGGGRKIKCIMENRDKLSPECAAAVAAVRAEAPKAGKAACAADAKQFCRGIRGEARLQCLNANKASLAPACAAVVEKRLTRLGTKAPPQ